MSAASDRASARVDYRLRYVATTEPRQVEPGWISGEAIPDAYNPERSAPGEWYDPGGPDDDDDSISEEEWLQHYFTMVMSEVIHEGAEWFRVDGKPWLDPHGDNEELINIVVTEFAERMIAIKTGTLLD